MVGKVDSTSDTYKYKMQVQTAEKLQEGGREAGAGTTQGGGENSVASHSVADAEPSPEPESDQDQDTSANDMMTQTPAGGEDVGGSDGGEVPKDVDSSVEPATS